MNLSKVTSVINLTESIKEFLSPNNVRSLIDDKYLNITTDNNDLLNWIWNDFLVSTFNRKDIMNNKNINRDGEIKDKGAVGMYAYFTTNERDLKEGFTKLINGTCLKTQWLSRKTKILNDDLSHVHVMGLKIQVVPLHKDRCFIREEKVHKRLNNSVLKDYVPKMYFGCSVIINETTIRLTFIEHLSGYIDLRSYFSNLIYRKRICINEALHENIKKLLIIFWNNGISHDEFAAQNIMVDIHNLYDIKLIDFGLLSLINLNLHCDKQWDISWKELHDIYNAYYDDLNVEEKNKDCNIHKIIKTLNLIHHFNGLII